MANGIKKVMILGSGPIIIGQAAEFDYAGTQACKSLKEEETDKTIETGPIISIRNPNWTSNKPMQDIPIMIFTINQWNAMQKDEFHIGAAPINPSELGRNSKYVFALPARYNFAFLPGYEEVENILKSTPLQPIEQ
jgi:hypothetical protein